MPQQAEFLGFRNFLVLAVFLFGYCVVAWTYGNRGEPVAASR